MPSVSIVVPVYNGARYLEEMLASVQAQTHRDWELLLVDDGSSDAGPEICREHARRDPERIFALAHGGRANLGQLATRIFGAGRARSEVIALLDQDDVWQPRYLEQHLRHWRVVEEGGARLSYGPGLYWFPGEPERDYLQPMPPGTPGVFAPPSLLSSFFEKEYAATPLPSCTLIAREVLLSAARFAGAARGSHCEDQYLWWQVAAHWPIAIHSEAWVRYRQHSESALARMLSRPEQARRAERAFLLDMERELLADDDPLLAPLRARLLALEEMPESRKHMGVGVAALSESFGEDRGQPILRYYTEQFLSEHQGDVRGHCLEFAAAPYTRKYGGDAVTRSDVLDLDERNPNATVVADLTRANDLRSNQYDCILCTFVLHSIFDLTKAVSELHRILKPGGVLLVAAPHVSMADPQYNELWRFTDRGLSALLSQKFSEVEVRAYGNSLTGAGQLRGLAAHEFTAVELDTHDPRFAVLIAARATKAGARASRRSNHPARAVILLYHRVADPTGDPHCLAVSPKNFAEQMEMLSRLGHAMTVDGLTRAFGSGQAPERGIVVTFDDGYFDNLQIAKPLLERCGVPATFFITTGQVGAEHEFWWDEIARFFLELPRLPRTLEGEGWRWELGDDAEWSDVDRERHRAWNVLEPGTPTLRHQAFRDACERMRELRHDAREQLLNQLAAQAGATRAARHTHRSLSLSGLRALASSPLFEVGAHSVTHARLAKLSPGEQLAEVSSSRAWLAEKLGEAPRSFAYPFGGGDDYSPELAALVQQQGFSAACANVPGVVVENSPWLALPRLMVMDESAGDLERRLRPYLDG